jgi:hypothetical protein
MCHFESYMNTQQTLVEHTLRIPDELLAWGRQDDVAVGFASPWAHDIESLLARAAGRTLPPRLTETLMSYMEAIRAGRGDLLRGIDMLTAEWLGLTYRFDTADGPVEFGRTGQWTYRELRVVLASDNPREALAAAQRCKSLVTEVFPQARVSAIIPGGGPAPCDGCGTTDAVAMMSLSTGSQYCGPCHGDLTRRSQRPEKKQRAASTRRR